MGNGDTINDNYNFWSDCPLDVSLTIFSFLDLQTLYICMFVCKHWRDLSFSTVQRFKNWQKIMELKMDNRGVTFRNKSNLDWSDIFRNLLLWSDVNVASIKQIYNYNLTNIKHIHVHKDNLIVVTDTEAKYYNLENQEHVKDISISCLDYVQSSQILVITLKNEGYFMLRIFGTNESNNSIELTDCKELTKIRSYKLEDNVCYVIDYRCMLRRYTWNKTSWKKDAITRYYSSTDLISAMHCHHSNLYVLLKTGAVWGIKGDLYFKKLSSVELPQYKTNITPVMFSKHSVAVSVPPDKEFKVVRHPDNDNLVIECPDMTCAMQHENVLFVGYRCGKMEIYITNNLIKTGKPEQVLNVREFDINIEDPAILELEVYEALQSHHLIVLTSTKILQFHITHPNN